MEEPITTVVKTEGVQAEIESKLLNLPPRFNMVKSDEDRKRKLALDFIALSNNRKSQFMRQDAGGTREDNSLTPFTPLLTWYICLCLVTIVCEVKKMDHVVQANVPRDA